MGTQLAGLATRSGQSAKSSVRAALVLLRATGLLGLKMVPVEGIEPPTFGLQNRCSTAELNRLIIVSVSTTVTIL